MTVRVMHSVCDCGGLRSVDRRYPDETRSRWFAEQAQFLLDELVDEVQREEQRLVCPLHPRGDFVGGDVDELTAVCPVCVTFRVLRRRRGEGAERARLAVIG